MYQITPGSRENGIVKTSLGFNTITHRPLKFKVYLVDIGGITMPTDGLVFYASLNGKTPNKAETGQSLTSYINNVVYQKIAGIDCGYFNNSRLSTSEVVNWNNVTLSAWLCSTTNGQTTSALHIGADTGNQMFKIGEWNGLPFVSRYSTVDETVGISILNKFHHVLATYNGSIVNFYIDGVLCKTINNSGSVTSSFISLGSDSNNQYQYNGYIAAARIYDRVLTTDEITLLSREFSSIWSCPRFSSNTREDSTWKVTCGSEYSDNYMCGKAFNGDFTYTRNKGWAGADNHPDEWLLIQNKVKPVNVKKLYFLPTNDSTADGFNSFKLYGSNDNSSFTLLYESDEALRASNGGRYYTFNNNKKYSYYKLTFRCSPYIFIGQIAMFSDTSATIDTAYDYF